MVSAAGHDQLERAHAAQPTNLTNTQLRLGFQLANRRAQSGAEVIGAFQQMLGFDHLEHRQGGRAGHRIAAVRRCAEITCADCAGLSFACKAHKGEHSRTM
ncbi:MAG: hypothetical protein COS34_08380 [Lysobacterales bacterium CG02_land_8_20_14_3_00_62_12]|nr:MAG: hypothetical protein COS34_08380 [Xanthomonadales bacterium CG02_land_8_20_14_3_00_62_12]